MILLIFSLVNNLLLVPPGWEVVVVVDHVSLLTCRLRSDSCYFLSSPSVTHIFRLVGGRPGTEANSARFDWNDQALGSHIINHFLFLMCIIFSGLAFSPYRCLSMIRHIFMRVCLCSDFSKSVC